MLASSVDSQQTVRGVAPEDVAASVFEGAMQAEGGLHPKRIYRQHVQDLCTADARRWGDGIVVYDRVTFVNEEDLASKTRTMIRQWKTSGSEHTALNPSEFWKLRRYAVVNCAAEGGQTKIVVALYRSAWKTYWTNWASLLGK